jgi:hypothetical protein
VRSGLFDYAETGVPASKVKVDNRYALNDLRGIRSAESPAQPEDSTSGNGSDIKAVEKPEDSQSALEVIIVTTPTRNLYQTPEGTGPSGETTGKGRAQAAAQARRTTRRGAPYRFRFRSIRHWDRRFTRRHRHNCNGTVASLRLNRCPKASRGVSGEMPCRPGIAESSPNLNSREFS